MSPYYDEFEDLSSAEYAEHVLAMVGDTRETREQLGLAPIYDPDSSESPANRDFNAWLAASHQ